MAAPGPAPRLTGSTAPPDPSASDRDLSGFPPLSHLKSMPKSSRRTQQRLSGDFRAAANGLEDGRAIPAGPLPAQTANGPTRGSGGAAPGFEGSRSPPNAKNTSHVPCKFFKVGQCQAGQACPFSHATDMSAFEQPCKYFSRGNCKFGHKCALLHVLPNGRIVNRPNASLSHLNIGNRVEPAPYHQESVLGNSLAQQPNMGQAFGHQMSQVQDLDYGFQASPGLQPYDMHSHSQHATPRDDGRAPLSPPMHLSALDAPLPASFDSQGISFMARHGPVAASVPSKFGFDSSPQSLPSKAGPPIDAFRNLHDGVKLGLGTSPSGPSMESSGPRMMHSQRLARTKMMSSSLPRPNMADEWNNDDLLFGGEEDYIPGNLSHLLSAEERTRRNSGRAEDPQSIRDSLAIDFSRKVGSPSAASPSSSRFAELFQKQKQDEQLQQQGPPGGTSGSWANMGSPIGRASLGSSPGVRSVSRSSGDLGLHVSSPPRHSATSMLSQQLQRTRLAENNSSAASSTAAGPPAAARHTSNPRMPAERAVSSTSVNANRIEEEQSDFLFAFDDLGSNAKPAAASTNSPWNPPKGAALGSNLGWIGDGRRSLDRESNDGKPSAVAAAKRGS